MAIGDVDLRQFDRAVRRMIKGGADVRPALRKVRPAFRKDQREHMKNQESSTGGKWPKLAAATRAKRLKKGQFQFFTKRGKLKKSAKRKLDRVLSAKLNAGAKIKIHAREINFRARPSWAGVHQKGGVVGRGSRVPKREFLWVSDPFLKVMAQRIAEHLIAAGEKRRLS